MKQYYQMHRLIRHQVLGHNQKMQFGYKAAKLLFQALYGKFHMKKISAHHMLYKYLQELLKNDIRAKFLNYFTQLFGITISFFFVQCAYQSDGLHETSTFIWSRH